MPPVSRSAYNIYHTAVEANQRTHPNSDLHQRNHPRSHTPLTPSHSTALPDVCILVFEPAGAACSSFVSSFLAQTPWHHPHRSPRTARSHAVFAEEFACRWDLVLSLAKWRERMQGMAPAPAQGGTGSGPRGRMRPDACGARSGGCG